MAMTAQDYVGKYIANFRGIQFGKITKVLGYRNDPTIFKVQVASDPERGYGRWFSYVRLANLAVVAG